MQLGSKKTGHWAMKIRSKRPGKWSMSFGVHKLNPHKLRKMNKMKKMRKKNKMHRIHNNKYRDRRHYILRTIGRCFRVLRELLK